MSYKLICVKIYVWQLSLTHELIVVFDKLIQVDYSLSLFISILLL